MIFAAIVPLLLYACSAEEEKTSLTGFEHFDKAGFHSCRFSLLTQVPPKIHGFAKDKIKKSAA